MNIELKESLCKFKEVTFNIIDMLKQENYDEVNILFSKREEIIKQMNLLKYTKTEFKVISEELNISNTENDVEKLLGEKKLKITKQMAEISNKKSANNNYKKYFNANSMFVNHQI